MRLGIIEEKNRLDSRKIRRGCYEKDFSAIKQKKKTETGVQSEDGHTLRAQHYKTPPQQRTRQDRVVNCRINRSKGSFPEAQRYICLKQTVFRSAVPESEAEIKHFDLY